MSTESRTSHGRASRIHQHEPLPGTLRVPRTRATRLASRGPLLASRGPVLALALIALTASACGRKPAAAAASAPQTVTIGAENVALAEPALLSTGPLISGSLAAEREATVRAEVAGPVLRTVAEAGQRVAAGQLLARLDAAALNESALSARSAVRSAELASQTAERNLERSQTLYQAGAVAQSALEGARTTAATAAAQLADARARARVAEEQLAKTEIRAPFAGVVSDRAVNAGDVVQPGAALFTIVQPSSMRLEASVPSSELSAVRVGAPVAFTVSGYPDRTFRGTVTRVNPAVDPVTRQVPIYVSIPNEGGTLVSGLYAEGRVASESRRALSVPTDAVNMAAGAPTVTRVRGGRAEQLPVELGLRDEQAQRVEIRSGVAAGDTLLLGAAQSVSSGTPVRIVATDDQPVAQR